METVLSQLCTEHGLNSASVSWLADHGRATVSVHWGDGACAHGMGLTFDAALADALAKMAAQRQGEAA